VVQSATAGGHTTPSHHSEGACRIRAFSAVLMTFSLLSFPVLILSCCILHSIDITVQVPIRAMHDCV